MLIFFEKEKYLVFFVRTRDIDDDGGQTLNLIRRKKERWATSPKSWGVWQMVVAHVGLNSPFRPFAPKRISFPGHTPPFLQPLPPFDPYPGPKL